MNETANLIATFAKAGTGRPLLPPVMMAVLWTLMLAAYFVVLAVFLNLRPDLPFKMQQPFFVLELALTLATTLSALLAASYLSLPDAGQLAKIRFLPFIPLAALGLWFSYDIATGLAMPMAVCVEANTYACIFHTVLLSLFPIGLLFLMIHRAAPTRRRWVGSLAALAGAGFGYIFLRLIDGHDDKAMLMFWHMLPVAGLTLLGFIAGGRWLGSALRAGRGPPGS